MMSRDVHHWAIILRGNDCPERGDGGERALRPPEKTAGGQTGTPTGLAGRVASHLRNFLLPQHIVDAGTTLPPETRDRYSGSTFPPDAASYCMSGILLTLLRIHASDPSAKVGIFPCHPVTADETLLQPSALEAYDFVTEHPDDLLLLGAPRQEEDWEFGWLNGDRRRPGTGAFPFSGIRRRFRRPTRRRPVRRASLCNTEIIFGTVETLLAHLRDVTPESFLLLNEIVRVRDTGERQKLIGVILPDLPFITFSSAFLRNRTERLFVLSMAHLRNRETAGMTGRRADSGQPDNTGYLKTGTGAGT
ncbi:MAG TPA: hypothetical protein VMW43_09030 [Bacteroidota bacterium]|nr:hypothetical protein [Bacteroidota bacterium]